MTEPPQCLDQEQFQRNAEEESLIRAGSRRGEEKLETVSIYLSFKELCYKPRVVDSGRREAKSDFVLFCFLALLLKWESRHYACIRQEQSSGSQKVMMQDREGRIAREVFLRR